VLTWWPADLRSDYQESADLALTLGPIDSESSQAMRSRAGQGHFAFGAGSASPCCSSSITVRGGRDDRLPILARRHPIRFQQRFSFGTGRLVRIRAGPVFPPFRHDRVTSLQQRLVKTGGRLIKHARYYWLLLAESGSKFR
jgi:hypothetical protein